MLTVVDAVVWCPHLSCSDGGINVSDAESVDGSQLSLSYFQGFALSHRESTTVIIPFMGGGGGGG